jgi:hypothetical protein
VGIPALPFALPFLNLEPLVANGPMTPCASDFKGVDISGLGTVTGPPPLPFTLGPVSAKAVTAVTTNDGPAPLPSGKGIRATSGVSNLNLQLAGIGITAELIDSSAALTCTVG